MLTPDYPVFAKRPILDCSFYDTIKKPNVTLVKAGLSAFDKEAVILTDGRRIECDVVVLATGYNMYWGMMVSGLPNFVLPAGPYSNLVANHAVLGEQLATIEVTREAADALVDEADHRLAQTAWVNNGTAHGYYRHPSGKVVLAIPYHNSVIWHKLRQPEMADYKVTKRADAQAVSEREPEMLEI